MGKNHEAHCHCNDLLPKEKVEKVRQILGAEGMMIAVVKGDKAVLEAVGITDDALVDITEKLLEHIKSENKLMFACLMSKVI